MRKAAATVLCAFRNLSYGHGWRVLFGRALLPPGLQPPWLGIPEPDFPQPRRFVLRYHLTIPKGRPMRWRKPQASAAREAPEEAGLVGEVRKAPIGSYRYG